MLPGLSQGLLLPRNRNKTLTAWMPKGSWIGARLSSMAALSPKKGGEDIASGRKGKGSTVHLVTEGEGLPLAFLVTRVTTVLTSGMVCGDGGFNLLYPTGNGPTAAADLVVLQRLMRPASLAGRWNGATAGWTIGVGWSLGMTGIPNPTSPF
jgi:hypothetical protein